jgi:hypothetical protein
MSSVACDLIKGFCNSKRTAAVKYFVVHRMIPVWGKLQVYAGFGLRTGHPPAQGFLLTSVRMSAKSDNRRIAMAIREWVTLAGCGPY